MLQLARAIVGIALEILRLGVLFLRSSRAIRAENLVLRRQLARYIERGINPKRVAPSAQPHYERLVPGLLSRIVYHTADPERGVRVKIRSLLVGPGRTSDAAKLPGDAVLVGTLQPRSTA